MTEITPDEIARIATRLYGELPGLDPAASSPQPAWPAQHSTGAQDSRVAEVPSNVTFAADGPEASWDGLRSFVQRMRAGDFHSDAGHWPGPRPESGIQQLSSGHVVPTEASRPLDVSAIRRDFPALHQRVHGKPLAWFDNAATTQKPQRVIDALSRYYAHDNSNIHRGAHTLAARSTDAFEQARQKVQRFLGAASPNEIVFVRGTTEGINLIAQSYGRKFLKPGDEVLLSTLEHHANIVPWQAVAKEAGRCCGSSR